MKKLLYLVIWSNGHEEKIYAQHWLDFTDLIKMYIDRFGLPELIYRKE